MDRQIRRGLWLAVTLGIGIGLMVGAALVAYAAEPRMTDEQVVARARNLGMVPLTEMPVREAPKVEPPPPQVTVVFAVRPGMVLDDVAGLLKEVGAITDVEGFLTRAQERDAATRLRAGVYTLNSAELKKPDAILDKLVGK